jgi:hypothetical protein
MVESNCSRSNSQLCRARESNHGPHPGLSCLLSYFACLFHDFLQEYIRRPWLDAYFLYSSTLGTQTFFMIGLPLLFFFGYDEVGRGCGLLFRKLFYLIAMQSSIRFSFWSLPRLIREGPLLCTSSIVPSSNSNE